MERNMPEDPKTRDILERLGKIMAEVSRGRFGKPEEIFELTKSGVYPDKITELAESFGMMIVKVEAREFQLQEMIGKLKMANRELNAAQKRLSRENSYLKKNLRKKFLPGRIIGKSHQVSTILDKIDKIAEAPVNVLITGETGTGKELFAKAIHYHSGREEKPFIALNCAALPENLIESELFGIEKGVATGVEKRIGRIEQADGGTLFLDEIGDMPLLTQAKILRVLEEKEVERVGGRRTIPVDIKVVAATNKDLKQEIKNKTFREDLFYRLNGVHLKIPPLRERKDDILLLVNAFMESFSRNMNTPVLKMENGFMEALKQYTWPGNVRELENEIERAMALACTDRLSKEDLSESVRNATRNTDDTVYLNGSVENLKEMEKRTIRRVLEEVNDNKTEASRRLGLSREGLRKKMNRYRMNEYSA